MKRNERTSPNVARDASAIMNFEAEVYVDADTRIECVIVPATFVRRAKRVAASALTQAADRPKRRGRHNSSPYHAAATGKRRSP